MISISEEKDKVKKIINTISFGIKKKKRKKKQYQWHRYLI